MDNFILKLVNNEEKFFEFIRILRTHSENIGGFLQQNQITKEQQLDYMSKHSKKYMICLSGEEPVGFVGVVDNDVRFAVTPSMKNLGIGTFMINELKKINSNLLAKVLLDNKSSQKVFEKCGFFLEKEDKIFKYYKYVN